MGRGGMPNAHANQRALDNYAARQARKAEKATDKNNEDEVHALNDDAHAYYQQLGAHGKG